MTWQGTGWQKMGHSCSEMKKKGQKDDSGGPESENASSRAQERRQEAGGGLRAIGQAGSGRLERSERRAHNLSTAVGWDSHTKA